MHKVVLDYSALISLAHGEILDLVLSEFEILVSKQVIEELEATSRYKDVDGKAASQVIRNKDQLKIKKVNQEKVENLLTSKIHLGEATCILIAQEEVIEALISDEFDTMYQLEYYSNKYSFDLGLYSTLIKALILRGELTKDEGKKIFDQIAQKRNWIGRKIYEYEKKGL